MSALAGVLPHRKRKAKKVLPAPLCSPIRHPLKWMLNKVQTLAWGVILTYVGVLIVVALYYLLFEVSPTMNNWWHHAVSNSDTRHNIRNVGEGFLGGLLGQMIVWNHYKVRPRKRKLLDKLEIALHVPNLKDDRKLSAGQTLAIVPLAMIYAVPGFLICLWLSHKLQHSITHLTNSLALLHPNVSHASVWTKVQATFTQNWDKKLMGYGAAFVFGRRPAKGFFDDVQLWFAQRRVVTAKPVRWYHPPTFRARYNEACAAGVTAAAKTQGKTQTIVTMSVVLVGIGMAGWGWYILNYIA